MGSPRGALSVSTVVAGLPVTAAEAKLHAKIDYSNDDALVDAFIEAATEEIERECNRHLMQRTMDWTVDCFPYGYSQWWFPANPVQSVSSITYYDSAGSQQTLATSVYGVSTGEEPARIYLKEGQSWPSVQNQPRVVTVQFVTGYAGTADSPISRANVPEALRVAILMMVAGMDMNREDQIVGTIAADNPTVERLIRPYRIHWM